MYNVHKMQNEHDIMISKLIVGFLSKKVYLTETEKALHTTKVLALYFNRYYVSQAPKIPFL